MENCVCNLRGVDVSEIQIISYRSLNVKLNAIKRRNSLKTTKTFANWRKSPENVEDSLKDFIIMLRRTLVIVLFIAGVGPMATTLPH